LKELWTFAQKNRLERFLDLVRKHELEYEVVEKGKGSGGYTVSVDEKDYVEAKRLLLEHRKRRTTT
jgi:hypothetical protein